MSDRRLIRDPAGAASREYDLIIVGGGIYGTMLALESTRRGLEPLLLERSDFGAATSFNSLRIVHGGFRYLQSADLHRFRESVAERSWFLRSLPDLVHPLACLMPLYGQGLKRKSILRPALMMNDLLSRGRNQGLVEDHRLPGGRVIGREETFRILPEAVPGGLQGGAVWYDARIPDSPRVLIELLLWAASQGGTALNYVRARELVTEGNRVIGVRAEDLESGQGYEYSAPVVINAAGPWVRSLAAGFDREKERLFHPSLAWNLLLDRPPISDHALAVAPPGPDGRVYFVVPYKGRIMAGTGHAELSGEPLPGSADARPSEVQLGHFLADLNAALPTLELTPEMILRVHAGLLPAAHPETDELAVREVIHDHDRAGGPRGLFSISGVKFTTARLVAEKTLQTAFPGRTPTELRPRTHLGFRSELDRAGAELDWRPGADDSEWLAESAELIENEAILHLDDLMLRRTCLAEHPVRGRELAGRVAELFGWDEDRQRAEIDRLAVHLSV